MLEAVRFLERLGRLLEGPPDAEQVERARGDLEVLRLADPGSDFLLTDEGAMWGPRRLDFEGGGWMSDLREAGIVVLAPPNDAAGFRSWLERLMAHVRRTAVVAPAPRADEAAAGKPVSAPDEAVPGPVAGALHRPTPGLPATPGADGRSLETQAREIWGLHETAVHGGALPFQEVARLAETLQDVLEEPVLRATPEVISPLDEYTTVHALNVGLLSMKLARHLAFSSQDVLDAGISGLLHDIGKTRLGELPSVSRELLSADERAVLQTHPIEGARLLLDAGAGFERAAIVAHEHHVHWRGDGGYPARHFDRGTHPLSRLVAVCDAYDVLRTERSYRPALDREAACGYLSLIAGRSLDPDVVRAFVDLAATPLPRVRPPATRPAARPHEIGWLPETGYDPDCEPRPVRI